MWEASTKIPEWRVAAIAVAFALGIMTACYFGMIAAVIFCLAFITVGFIACRGNKRTIAAMLSAVFLLGACRFIVHMQVPLSDISRVSGRIIAFEGTIAEDPDARPTGTRIVLRTSKVLLSNGWHQVTGLVMLNVRLADENCLRLSYGDRLKVKAHPYQPFAPTNPGQFSYKDYLARQGIYMCATIKRPDQLQIESTSTGNTLTKAAIAAKKYITDSIQRIHPKEESSVIIGIILCIMRHLD